MITLIAKAYVKTLKLKKDLEKKIGEIKEKEGV